MARLRVTRLLQNPLGAVAPPGEAGDIVRVSDGRASVYLDPDEYDDLDEDTVRMMLSRVIPCGLRGTGKESARRVSVAVGVSMQPLDARKRGPLTAPRPPRERTT
jgi:hypothetical protein